MFLLNYKKIFVKTKLFNLSFYFYELMIGLFQQKLDEYFLIFNDYKNYGN